jgi:hypothetical protein
MSGYKILSLVVVLALALALTWWALGFTQKAPAPSLTPTALNASSAGDADRDEPQPPVPTPAELLEEARVTVTEEVAPEPAVVAPVAAPLDCYAFVDARFVDAIGNPWSGVRLVPIAPSWLPSWNPGEGVLSEADGRVLLKIVLPERRNPRSTTLRELKLEFVATRAGCTSVARTATVREDETSHLGFIVLGPGVRVLGRVVDADGKGVAQARIGMAAALLQGDDAQMARHGSPTFLTTPGTVSFADGHFAIEGAAPGAQRVWAHADGYRHAWSEPVEIIEGRDVLGIVLKLHRLLPSDRIAGQVVDPDGAPVAHCGLMHLEHRGGTGKGSSMSCDEQGRFELIVQHDDSTHDFSAEDVMSRFTSQSVKGVLPGTLDVVIRLLAREQMLVRVLDEQEAVVENAKFDVMSDASMYYDPTRTRNGA